MKILLSSAWALFRSAPATPDMDVHDVLRQRRRVALSDVDVLRHMNNSSYLAVMDLGRYELLRRSGIATVLRERGWIVVNADQTISYRRSLRYRASYTVETRVVGYAGRSIFVEQSFLSGGEVVAKGFVHGKVLKRSGGAVPAEELSAATGVDLGSFPAPAWITEWAARSGRTTRTDSGANLLPSGRAGRQA